MKIKIYESLFPILRLFGRLIKSEHFWRRFAFLFVSSEKRVLGFNAFDEWCEHIKFAHFR